MQLDLIMKNALKSQKFSTFTKQVTNAYAYIDAKNNIPAGSPYPYQTIQGVNLVKDSLLKVSSMPHIGDKAQWGDNVRVGEDKVYPELPEFTLTNVPNSLDPSHELLNIQYDTSEDDITYKMITVIAKLSETVLPGTTVNISFDLEETSVDVFPEVMAGLMDGTDINYMQNEPQRIGPSNFFFVDDGELATLQRVSSALAVQYPCDYLYISIGVTVPARGGASDTLKIGRLQVVKGAELLPYTPSPSEGGTTPEESGMPEGLIFTDICCAEYAEDHTREASLLTSGKVIEAKLPVPLSPQQKTALKAKGIQFY